MEVLTKLTAAASDGLSINSLTGTWNKYSGTEELTEDKFFGLFANDSQVHEAVYAGWRLHWAKKGVA